MTSVVARVRLMGAALAIVVVALSGRARAEPREQTAKHHAPLSIRALFRRVDTTDPDEPKLKSDRNAGSLAT